MEAAEFLTKRSQELQTALAQAMAERDALTERIQVIRTALSETQNTMQALRENTQTVDAETIP